MMRTPLALAVLAALTAPATAASVRWVASTETSRWQERTVAGAPTGEPDLALLPARHQRVDGFGGCFNEYGWQALAWLPEADRASVLKRIFDPQDGLRFSFCRVPIGANDSPGMTGATAWAGAAGAPSPRRCGSGPGGRGPAG